LAQAFLPHATSAQNSILEVCSARPSLNLIMSAQTLGKPVPEGSQDEHATEEVGQERPVKLDVGFLDIAKHFVLMGWTAFGGPAAHVGLFQKVFVEQLGWMSPEIFTELFAVCQCLPGPSSTQLSFALGTTKKGLLGGLLSGMLFQYPGAIIMTVFGLTAHHWASPQVIAEHDWLAGLVGGLGASGVALVASAGVGLWSKACNQADTKAIAGSCCIVLLYFTSELIAPPGSDGRNWMWIFPVLIISGGAFLYIWRGPLDEQASEAAEEVARGIQYVGVGRVFGGVLTAFVFLTFFSSYIFTNLLDYKGHEQLFWFFGFWRTGTVIWGGGQVVLPLLENEVVATGWVDSAVFFSGLALAQAMPGPLFNFAGFLGAAAGQKGFGDAGPGIGAAVVCWLGLFGPGVMLIFGVLPFWARLRSNTVYKRALPGLNAAAVGLLMASLVQMATAVRENNTKPSGPIPKEASTCIGLFAFWGVHWLKILNPTVSLIKAPIVVVVGGLLGLVAGAVGMK